MSDVMTELVFSVKSSSSDVCYEVRFLREDDIVFASCECDGAKNGNQCKHRLSLLNGDASSVIGEKSTEMETLRDWFSGSEIEDAINDSEQAAAIAQEAKKAEKKLKKQVARLLSDGWQVRG